MQLSSHQAHKVIEGAEGKAREMGLPVVIAVLDAGAHLKAFRRMDGAVLASIDIALRKASTAVLFQANSEDIWEYCKPGAPAPGLELTTAAWPRSAAAYRSRVRTGKSLGRWASPAAPSPRTSTSRRPALPPSRP